jgi:3',5'-cyclic AMP phosphodiesterase CpdA
MSAEQLAFLDDALARAKEAEHVFVFLHHPR